MSIADKLTYLNTTKQLLKTEINKINNVLDDNSTFRSYPEELFNGYLDILNNGTDTLWNNLEKVSQTGTEAVLENVETAPMKIELSGNTSQETTTGKNFLEYTLENLKLLNTNGTWNENVYSLNGISYTINEDLSITTNGTATATTNLVLIDTLALTSGTKYILSGCPSNGAYNTYNLRIYAGTNYSIDIGVGFEFTFETQNLIRVNFSNGATANNLIFKPMVRLANITDDSYEPYTGGQPSPSPDYPQEVKVVKGENVVSVQGKQLFDKDNANIFNGYVNNANKLLTSNNYHKSIILPINSNTTYTISKMVTSRFSVSTFADTTLEPNVSIATNVIQNFSETSLTITSGEDDKYLVVWLYGVNTDTSLTLDEVLSTLQIEENSTATPYVPYSKTDYPINLVSKNLFSTENLVNATITDTGEYLTADNRCTGDYVFLDKSQENLALSFNLNILFMGIAFYDENKQYLSRATINNTNLLTAPIPANAEYCRPFFQFTTSPAAKIDAKIVQQLGTQLEYGTERTNYVSYFTPIELCKINTYKDYFHKDSGKWYVHKEIGKVVLDGTENWSSGYAQLTDYFTGELKDVITNIDNSKTSLNNYFVKLSSANERKEGINYLTYNNSKYFDIRLLKTRVTTLEDFKTWLSTHNTIVYYVLATPTDTEITNTTLIEQLEAIYKAKSVKDKTYITQTNDELPFILDVEAIKEYEVN